MSLVFVHGDCQTNFTVFGLEFMLENHAVNFSDFKTCSVI